VNSEELELSLRTEFESYLKGVLAEVRQDVSDFQKNFEAEFEKHKAQMDDAFRNLSTRFESDKQFDRGFTESVVEHLRLARDEGAQLAATAFTEAEALRDPAIGAANYDQIRNAVDDIASKTTQSSILRALVQHASNFAPRGAFFIVKNENFIGWKAFGRESSVDESAVRDISFPTGSDTILADAAHSLRPRFDGRASDSLFLGPLGFSPAAKMAAIPLAVRGRGVAVLYADNSSGGELNIEALETLVRVAGLTVELQAAAQTAKAHPVEAAPAVEPAVQPSDAVSYEPVVEAEPHVEALPEHAEPEVEATEYYGDVAVQEAEPAEGPISKGAEYFEPVPAEPISESQPEYFEPVADEPSVGPDFSTTPSFDAPASTSDFAFAGESNGTNGTSYEAAPEAVVEVAAAQPVRSRFSDKNVDLPIEVDESERRDHNDARRFARLLVSEIKLYNEQKVKEGRDSGDLYDRLRDAIDRSREMYEKRVKPPVASKFDYFHYELLNNLADGDDGKLGGSYPGASV
jgi:hypothetical protein